MFFYSFLRMLFQYVQINLNITYAYNPNSLNFFSLKPFTICCYRLITYLFESFLFAFNQSVKYDIDYKIFLF